MKMNEPISIAHEAMLISLTVSTWDGRKLDRQVSKEVAEMHNAKMERAGRYNKCLVDVRSTTFKAVQRAASAVREFHEEHTLPWLQNGTRILTAAEFMHYSNEMRHLQEDFQKAADRLVADYPRLKLNAKAELNGLYKEADYPTPKQLRSKFDCSVRVYPVPTADDFRVRISENLVENIRDEITANVHSAVLDAMRDAWQRLYDEVSHLAGKLSETRKTKSGEQVAGIFRDTLVSNVAKQCDILQRLNLTNDAKLEEMRAKTERLIKGLDAQDLRDNDALRAQVAAEAARIEREMSIFMRGPK